MSDSNERILTSGAGGDGIFSEIGARGLAAKAGADDSPKILGGLGRAGGTGGGTGRGGPPAGEKGALPSELGGISGLGGPPARGIGGAGRSGSRGGIGAGLAGAKGGVESGFKIEEKPGATPSRGAPTGETGELPGKGGGGVGLGC